MYGLTADKILAGILDKPEYVTCFNSLFSEGGRCAGIFHYQISSSPDISKEMFTKLKTQNNSFFGPRPKTLS